MLHLAYGFWDYFEYIRDANIITELKKKKSIQNEDKKRKTQILTLNTNVKMLCDLMWC